MRTAKCIPVVLPCLLSLCVLLLAACDTPQFDLLPFGRLAVAAPSQQIYRVGLITTDIASFDPGTATESASIQAIQMVFTGMVQLNNQLQVVDQLAQSHSVSSDGLTYTFHLRPDLKFSDGAPLNAYDVAYSLDRALSPSVAQLNGVTQTYLGLIKDSALRLNGQKATLIGDSILVKDKNTVALVIKNAAPYFLQALTYPTAFVVERSLIDKWGSRWTDHLSDNGGSGGAGPFKVKKYSHTTGIQFVPNPNYYGPLPRLHEVDLNFYRTVNTSYVAYQTNQLDNSGIPPANLEQAMARGREFRKYKMLTIVYIAMNWLYKPFDNVHIRQAFALAVNKDALARAIYHDLQVPTCHIVPQGMPGYNASLQCPAGTTTRGNIARARALFAQGLREEGLTVDRFPAIRITYRSDSTSLRNEIITMRLAWQEAFGITTTAQILNLNTLLAAANTTTCTSPDLTRCLNRGLQMWASGWDADYPDPQDWLTLQFDKDSPNNNWNYGQNFCTCAAEQQRVQQLLERADADLSPNRMSLYNQAEQALVNDVAWLPMFQVTGNYLLKPYVIGVVDNPIGQIPPNDWGHIFIAAH